VTKLKSLTARELFSKDPDIKKQLWGGSFWTSGYYANTVGFIWYPRCNNGLCLKSRK
jgi:REP element-mobilizing transposase RayT